MSLASHTNWTRIHRLLTFVALIAILFGATGVPKLVFAATTPTIVWSNPADITYGTLLDATNQLNATANDASTNVPGTFSYTPAIGDVLDAGNAQTLHVEFTPDDLVTYDITSIDVTINVLPAPLTITADNASVVYGAGLPSFTATPSGLVNGDSLGGFTPALDFSTNAIATSGVGVYTITPIAADANYAITLTDGALTITPAPLTISADNQTKFVGSVNPALTASYAGFVNGDDEASLIPAVSLSTTAVTGSPTGSYPISASGAVNANYTITFADGALLVTDKLVPIITWSDPAAITYGTPLDATQLNATANVAGTFSYSPAIGDVLGAGNTQALHVDFTPTDGATYASVSENVNIDVQPAALTITADAMSVVYGAGLPTFTATPSGLVNGDTLGGFTPALNFSSTASNNSDAGAYTITPIAADANYAITLTDGALTITPAPLAITADDQAKHVGSANPTLTASYSGFVNGDTVSSLSTPASLSTTAVIGSAAGSYPITASGAVNANYTISFIDGTLLVTDKLVPNVTWANPGAITYGTALGATQLNATADVPGTFSYNPLLGHMLEAGNSQALDVIFTPTDSATYENVPATVSINVQPAALTITADDASMLYGAGLPSFTGTSSALVNGDTLATLATPPSYSSTASSNSGVGSYPITPDAIDTNYNITFVAGTLAITPAPLTISADNQTKHVGAANPALTASYNGFVNGDIVTDLISPVSLSTTAATGSPVDTYPISASGAASPNYTISFVAGILTVTPKLVPTITWSNPAAITYGTALGATQQDATADAPGTFSYTPIPGDVLNAGAGQSLQVDFTPTDSTTYASVSANVSINVLPAALTITADSASMLYGAGLPSFTGTSSALVNGDTLAMLDTPPTYSSSASSSSNAGSYPITPSAADTNYNITLVAGTLTITPAPLTISADNQIKHVGAANPALTASYAGFVNSDSAASLIPPASLSTTAVTGSPVDTYPISASGAANPNYTITYIAGILTVTDKLVPIITWSNPAAIVYGTALGATQQDAIADVPGTFSYTPIPGDMLHASNAQLLGTIFTPTDSATYESVSKNVSIDVLPAPLTITAASASKPYGAGLPGFTGTSSALVNGDTLGTLATPPSFSSTASIGSNVGSYPITPSAADANYAITLVAGTLTVTPAPLTISADNQTKHVGATNPALTASYTGFVNGDSATSLIPPASLSTTAVTGSAAGSYPISASGAVNTNYTISYVAGTLLVTAKLLPNITWANPAAITYGSALGATQLNATADVPGTFVYTPPTGQVLDAGTSQTLNASFTPTDSVTYAVVAPTRQITVLPAALTITAASASKLYGAGLPSFTGTSSALVNGDTLATLATPPSYSSTASSSSNVGSYPITPSAVDGNYAITLVAGTLTVAPVPLTISADAKIKQVNTLNPTLTASYSGFVNGDSATSLSPPVSLSTTATTGSAVGAYTISASGAVNANYTITFANGILTVTAKQIPTISWANPATIIYGTGLGATQLNATANVPGALAYTPPAGTILNAGSSQTLHVVFTPTDTTTYATVETNVSISVLRAALSIKADDKTKAAGTENPTLTATYTGLVNGDTIASLDTPATLTTTASKNSPAGTYSTTGSGATDANYTISFVSGTLTVTASGPIVDATNGIIAAPDSYFRLQATGFTPNSVLIITVNGHRSGTVTSNENGVATFLMYFSSRALPGVYMIVVTENTPILAIAAANSAQILVTLDTSAPKLANPGGLPVLSGQPTLYLPILIKT